MSPRTLRAWKSRQKKVSSKNKVGRPVKAVTLREMIAIAREWRQQCYPGSRPVMKALPHIRVRVVREIISALKARRIQRRTVIQKQVRKNIRVKKPGTLITVDGTSVGRGNDFLVIRDRGSLSVSVKQCGGHLNSENTIKVLKTLKKDNRLPLVLGTDNGSPFICGKVKSFLEKNQIIHLKNLPHVPQHNGACENAVREFKELLSNKLNPEVGIEKLNQFRKRRLLGWKTSKEFEDENFAPVKFQERQKFYNRVQQDLKEALKEISSALDKRKIEREVILKTMETFSLIKVTRGSPSAHFKAEEIT